MACGAKRRVAALMLLGASACAQGLGLDEGGETAATLATMAMTSQAATPTDTGPPTSAGSSEETGGDSTTGEVPTTGSEGTSSTGEETTTTGPDQAHPELYPYDRTHSPITAYVADNLRAIAAATPG